MRNFTCKNVLCMFICFAFLSIRVGGQCADNSSPMTGSVQIVGSEKVLKYKLQKAPISLTRAIERQSRHTSPGIANPPSYVNEQDEPRVMLGGYAINIIGGGSCSVTSVGNVFGFDVNNLCQQITYPSPFTSAGFGVPGITLSVYCGDWIGDKWLVFTTAKQSGQTYLGYWMTFDPITYTVDMMMEANSSMQCQDMAYDVTSSLMYGVGLNNELYQFSIDDNLSILKGKIRLDGEPFNDRFMGLACNSQGELYAINVDKNLYRIDKNTAAATLIGSLNLDRNIYSENLQSATFDLRSNTMYFALRGTAFHELYTINTTTGEASLVGNMYAETAGLFSHYYSKGTVPPEMVTDFKAISSEDDPLKIKLSWKNPEKNFNGEKLTDLSKIYIYRGVVPTSLQKVDSVDSSVAGAEMSFEVREKAPGTYYYGAMAVTKSEKTSLLAGGAAYCFESSIPYSMGFEEEDNYMPLSVPAGWRIDTLTAKYANTGKGAILTTSTAGNKISINGLKSQKGALYELTLWGYATTSGRKFTVDLGNVLNKNTSNITSKVWTKLTVTGVAEGEILPVTIKSTSSGVYLDDVSIKMLYPGTTPDSVKAPKVEIAESGKLEANVSWTNPVLDAGGNPLAALTGVIIQKTSAGGAFTAGVTADTIPATVPGEKMSCAIEIPKAGVYYFRLIPMNDDGPSPYYYDLGKVGYIGNDTIPAAPANLKVVLGKDGKIKLNWDAVTTGKSGGFLGGDITNYEVTVRNFDMKTLLNETYEVTSNEYTTSVLPRGYYIIGVKAVRANKDKGTEALVYVAVGADDSKLLISNKDYQVKPASTTYPMFIGYTASGYSALTQNIIKKEELNERCVIDTLIYYLYVARATENRHRMTIYIGYTDKDAFEKNTDWISIRDDRSQTVFSGEVVFEPNTQMVKIPIKPFYYDGSRNLVVTFLKHDAVPVANNDSYSFVGKDQVGVNCLLYAQRQKESIETLDDTSDMGTGSFSVFTPTMLLSKISGLATLKGTVTDKESGEAVTDVKIAFIPKAGQERVLDTYIMNDKNTGTYDFAYLPKGTYTVSLSKLGYKEASAEITVSEKEVKVLNFSMEASSNIILKGKVVNSKNIAISGVAVKAEGLLNYEAVTDANGDFAIQKVLSDNTYKMSFVKDGYASVEKSWTLASKDTTFAALEMPYIAYPVAMVDATTTRETSTIKIGKPAVMKEVTWAVDDQIAHKIGGSREQMIAAVEFYPSDIKKFDLIGKELMTVDFYAGDATANYVLHIYEDECATEIYTQDIGNSLSGWQSVMLGTRYKIDPAQEFSIAIEAKPGYSGAPFALDNGPCTFKSDKVFFDGEWTRISTLMKASGYDYNWQIKGVFGQELEEHAAGGYLIYRAKADNVGDPAQWIKITDSPVQATPEGFIDYNWRNADTGAYKYVVKADWMNDNLSEPAFSNFVYKGLDANVKVQVNTNGSSKKGAVVTLTNLDKLESHRYAKEAESNGLVEFTDVWKGWYSFDIAMTGYPGFHKDSLQIVEDIVVQGGQMNEYISDPQIVNSTINKGEVKVDWTMKYPANWSDDFEGYPDFTINGYGEYILDGKQEKYLMNSSYWDNCTKAQSFIVFNPYTTEPPVSSYKYYPHSGDKELAAIAARSGVNKDFVARAIDEGNGVFSFYVRGIASGNDKERFDVLYSETDAKVGSFKNLSDATLEATNEWVKYSFKVPANAKYVAVKCVSEDLQALLLDDWEYIAVNEGVPSSYEAYLDGNKLSAVIDADATSYLFTGLSNGKHTLGVKAMFASGVSSLVTTEVNITDAPDMISMEEVASVKLYPNPSVDGIFTITASDDYEVEVVTFDGKVIYYTKMENGMVRLDLSAQPKGCYMIKLMNDEKSILLKAAK